MYKLQSQKFIGVALGYTQWNVDDITWSTSILS